MLVEVFFLFEILKSSALLYYTKLVQKKQCGKMLLESILAYSNDALVLCDVRCWFKTYNRQFCFNFLKPFIYGVGRTSNN